MRNKINLEALKKLQERIILEEENDNDCQESPRFWVIKDIRESLGVEGYDYGKYIHYHLDEDMTEFTDYEELVSYIEEYLEDDETLMTMVEDGFYDFDGLFDYLLENHENFHCEFVRKEWVIKEDTMFITKEDAKRHLELNKHHYTSSAHTYAMTAWRSPGYEELLKFFTSVDLSKLEW